MNQTPEGVAVAVLGASPKEDRYSFKAVRMLREHGYDPRPVHPAGHTVDGIAGVKSLSDLKAPVDTITCYVNSAISDGEFERMLALKPRRVVFNPGAENQNLADRLTEAGVYVVDACTLVMLRTGQF